MSENKCPCCGDTISIFPDSGFYECDNCPFMCALEDFPRIAAAMKAEARHNALVEATKNLRDSQMVLMRVTRERYTPKENMEHDYALKAYREARAEVDRLINESAADCKGEG